VGDEPFAVLLADDLIYGATPCLKQMIDVYRQTGGSVLACMDVPPEHTPRYGIIDPGARDGAIVEVAGLVEKPAVGDAPSNHAIVGRYILQPDIFEYLSEGIVGTGGEIQLTDAIARLIGASPVHGYSFEGVRYDCGDKIGYLEANVALALDRDDLRDDFTAVLRNLLNDE
jgi:UTP--glucose-1-phosphate uridylyltransferase